MFSLKLNGRLQPSHLAQLQLGDIVEMVEAAPEVAAAPLSKAPANESEMYRREFEIYHLGGSTTTAHFKDGRLHQMAA